MSSVHEMDCLGKETISVSGRSGAQSAQSSGAQLSPEVHGHLHCFGPV